MKKNISIVSGTLNRKDNVERLIKNTIDKYDFLELVLVDGGSTDGTIDYVKSLNYENLVFLNYGKRSSYSHFMNLGIRNTSNEFICIWDDDALLINSWTEVLNVINSNKYDFYIFNWKLGNDINLMQDRQWLEGNDHSNDWNLVDETKNIPPGLVTMNYGIFDKQIFREIGMNNTRFDFWYADNDLSNRAHLFGYKHKSLRDIKVFVKNSEKNRKYRKKDLKIFQSNLKKYHKKKLPRGTEYLKDSN
tara:strand:- start:166 stop:906 length:741 start_codon:yes stop_codon:yes gene_type:complete